MSTKLVILGLLQERPLHGYELKQIIEEHMGDWTNIAFGSIYFALNNLREVGFVEMVTEEKVGNRPSRSVYRITKKGKSEILSLMREIWQKTDRLYFQLDIALAFSGVLSVEEIKGFLKKRIDYLEESLRKLKKHEESQLAIPEVPKTASAIFRHTEYHLQAELSWLKELQENFNNGVLP